MFHLFSYSFQLPRTTRTHNSVLYPGANQRFSILCWWQRNKSYSRGWISVSLRLKIKKGSIDLKKLCLCTASLILYTRLAVHKQSFLNLLLRQNGHHLTKVYWGILWLWRGGEGEGGKRHVPNTRLQKSLYFFVFKYVWTVKQKVWNEAETWACEAHVLRTHKTLMPHFTDFFPDFEKKPTVLLSNQTLDSLARSVCDRTVSYLVISW